MWYQGTEEYPEPKNNGVTDWSTDIKLADPAATIGSADEDLYRDLLELYIEIVDDCDVDCQAKGSQLTLIA